MTLLTAILLLLCGLLAAASFIIQKQPDARQYIDRLLPWQGWIGFVTCIDGAFVLLGTLLHPASAPNGALGGLIAGGLQFVLGFLMGYALITHYIFRNKPETIAKAQKMRDKLATAQIPLGLAALVVGGWGLLSDLFGH
jgi:hypothetical protein